MKSSDTYVEDRDRWFLSMLLVVAACSAAVMSTAPFVGWLFIAELTEDGCYLMGAGHLGVIAAVSAWTLVSGRRAAVRWGDVAEGVFYAAFLTLLVGGFLAYLGRDVLPVPLSVLLGGAMVWLSLIGLRRQRLRTRDS